MKHEHGSILVVEDHDTTRAMLCRFLEAKGFAVAEAANGDEALAAVGRQRPDLVLLDSMLPGRSGLEVLERLRREYSATDLPVIMSSGRGRSADIIEALRLGANDYLVKPFDITEALARLQTHLSLKLSVDRIVSMEENLARQNAELAKANQRMREDLEAAAAVQRAASPRAPLQVPGAKFAWHFRPCDELAGDLLNVAVLDNRHVAVYVLDVVGHGVKAALLAVMVSRVLSQLLVPDRREANGSWRHRRLPMSSRPSAVNSRGTIGRASFAPCCVASSTSRRGSSTLFPPDIPVPSGCLAAAGPEPCERRGCQSVWGSRGSRKAP